MPRGEVAVVIPCFDAGRTLGEALDSARSQTRSVREIVVVDDGSRDPDTLATLESLEASASPGLRVLHTDHGGTATARNRGIAAASAAYILPLDADDRLKPTAVEKVAAVLDSEAEVDFVGSGLVAFGGARYESTPDGCGLFETLARGSVHQSTVYRRALWERVGGYDPEAGVCANLDFWLSALEQGARGRVLSEPLLEYRVRAGSLYHGALERGDYGPTLRAVLRKHAGAIEGLGPELLLAKEDCILTLRGRRDALRTERGRLEAELAELTGELARTPEPAAGRAASVDWGDLGRLTPLSQVWGFDRGGAVDRHYIHGFLERHQADIKGRVLEVKDSGYTRRFGGDRVVTADVVDVDPANPLATFTADLASASTIPSDTFDCFVLTQTLHKIFDVHAVVAEACRVLKPGGVLLCTVPAVSRIDYEDGGLESGDYWRFTEASLRRLLLERFPPGGVEVTAFGNIMVCTAFLYGLAPDELRPQDLAHTDRWFPLVFGARAVKPHVDC